MKKVFKFMMMALVAIVMSAGFAACSSSDDDSSTPVTPGGGNTPETPAETQKASTTIRLKFSQDILDAAKLVISYTDVDGKTKKEEITTTEYSKDINYTNGIPSSSNMKFDVILTKKSSYPEKDSYYVYQSNKGSEIIRNSISISGDIEAETTMTPAEFKSWLESYNGKNLNIHMQLR